MTVGRAPGFVQANVVILPAALAGDFLEFCAANPQSCPVLGVSGPGNAGIPEIADDLDIRTDLPRYEIHGPSGSTFSSDLTAIWTDDLVTVAIGCWFGAEESLRAAGIRLRHVELGIQGPLFRTAIPAKPAGRFAPNLVVSMRPFATADVERVAEITAGLPLSHGAPLRRGSAEALGIEDVSHPDWGETLLPEPGETAMFWACGLTAVEALRTAGIERFITHAPGSMLVTDLVES